MAAGAGTEHVVGRWPVARRYSGEDRERVSLPVGGIGTGTVGFGGRGQLRDWELENRPAKGTRSELTFLACRVKGASTPAQARILEGSLFDEEVQGEQGSPAPMAGIPRFAECEFEATYPFGRALLADPHFPVRAAVEVFNPFSPGDDQLSGLPLAVITVSLRSLADEPLDCSLMFSVESFVGQALRRQGWRSQPWARAQSAPGLKGYLLSDDALAADDEARGTLAAAVTGDGTWLGPTWGIGKWWQGEFAMWKSYLEAGEPAEGMFGVGSNAPSSNSGSAVAGTIGARRLVPPGGTTEVVFLLSWHFPNRRSWVWGRRGPEGASGPETVGNYYATQYDNAWDVLVAQAPHLDRLRDVTERFTAAFWGSDLSPAVKEAALFNLSTLRSQTFFRTADGTPLGWEGCLDDAGSCLGSCTHVWNYDVATAFLFGSLARRMREVEYLHATADDGAMSFRVLLPLDKARDYRPVAADGQFGCVLKLFREWRLSGDDAWLERVWPACRRSIEFAWVEGGWDADRDGLAEGAQHNTMDVEYFGPTPVIQSWYLAALQAAAEMASAVGEEEFAATCRAVFASGRSATEEQLFNGAYYQQKVVPPGDFSKIAPRLRHTGMGAEDALHPEFQIEDGCLIDQLVGDTYGRLFGLAPVFKTENVKAALASIHRLNYVEDLGDWTNYVRTYAVRGERGHIVLSYPNGLPAHPMPYWSEVWTGIEYVYAIGLVQAGDHQLAEDVVAAARERFTGRRRNPFDEAECGHHYARPLSSWGLVAALTGFDYDGREGVMRFAAAPAGARWFWSNGTSWGTVEQSSGAGGTGTARLEVLGGHLRLERVLIGDAAFEPPERGLVGSGTHQLLPSTA